MKKWNKEAETARASCGAWPTSLGASVHGSASTACSAPRDRPQKQHRGDGISEAFSSLSLRVIHHFPLTYKMERETPCAPGRLNTELRVHTTRTRSNTKPPETWVPFPSLICNPLLQISVSYTGRSDIFSEPVYILMSTLHTIRARTQSQIH